ncbi:MAG: hypothetical protein R3343_13340, partial [Nitriliruptorales bacterium]|nr:hypothetical protein [Nitriliruptorales bacterium]
MRFAWGLWVAALLLTAAAIAFAVATPDGFWVGPAVGFVAFPVALGGAGLLIARRGNNTGWVLLVGMLLYGVQAVTASYADFALPDGRPGALVVAWIASWVFVPLLGVIVALFYTFPDGRLPEGRWRAVAIVGAVGFVLLTLATPFTSERLAENEPVSVLNPLNPYYIGDDLPWIGFVSSVGGLLFLLGGLLGGSASLISRYRRSSGERRYQIKWFAFAGAVLAASMVVTIALDALGVAAPVGEWLFAVGVFTMPVAIAIALFKYRLYEIDLVIRRTVVYAGLAGFIGVLYISIVAGVGALVGSGDEPNLALSVAATAIVAVAFQPARERLTTFANRLVFGKRATPYEVLSRFSSHLGETVATDETLERMAQLLSEGTGADHAQVSLDIDGQLRVGAVWPPDRRAEDDPEHLVEVVHEGERLGALSLAKPPGEELTPQDERLMADLASQAGLVLRNVRLTEQLRAKLEDLRRSRQRLVSAQDDERRRLERDLHDGA